MKTIISIKSTRTRFEINHRKHVEQELISSIKENMLSLGLTLVTVDEMSEKTGATEIPTYYVEIWGRWEKEEKIIDCFGCMQNRLQKKLNMAFGKLKK